MTTVTGTDCTVMCNLLNTHNLGSGGSMVARLKLKEIDGRAPPGVEPAA